MKRFLEPRHYQEMPTRAKTIRNRDQIISGAPMPGISDEPVLVTLILQLFWHGMIAVHMICSFSYISGCVGCPTTWTPHLWRPRLHWRWWWWAGGGEKELHLKNNVGFLPHKEKAWSPSSPFNLFTHTNTRTSARTPCIVINHRF